LKHKGQPWYKLARKGITVEREPRNVHIYDLRLLKLDLPRVEFRVACTKGTYVRTLCSDIGDVLGCGAHLAELRRLRSGAFDVRNARTLDDLLKMSREELQDAVIPILKLVKLP
jgi:tRNA pseudouridine55 synthase